VFDVGYTVLFGLLWSVHHSTTEMPRPLRQFRNVPQAAIVIAAIGLFICTEVGRRFTAEAADEDVPKSEVERAAIMPSAGDSHRHRQLRNVLMEAIHDSCTRHDETLLMDENKCAWIGDVDRCIGVRSGAELSFC
jgi:hypothetical protein